MDRTIRIRAFVLFPNGPELAAEIKLSGVVGESFYKLPRDRELFRHSATEAELQMSRRQEVAREIAQLLACKFERSILDALASGDPQFGYSPEEWAKIQSGGN